MAWSEASDASEVKSLSQHTVASLDEPGQPLAAPPALQVGLGSCAAAASTATTRPLCTGLQNPDVAAKDRNIPGPWLPVVKWVAGWW